MKLLGFLQSKTNESLKRVIALIFAISLIVIAFITKSENVLLQIIYGFFVLIALLLGLATIETLADIWKNKNNSQNKSE
jgi:hypothetical protein